MTVLDTIDVDSAAAIAEVLHELSTVRLIGSGSRQDRLPAPVAPVTLLRCRGLRRIQRLDREDLTGSFEPGLSLAELGQALAENGLSLPGVNLDAGGTLGGAFAAADAPPAAPGQLTPRGLLLGCEGVLADGTLFKSGSRVVKSVAGFDLQKLFVGSRGRLFAATLLHLKLRRRPAATAFFAVTGLDLETAAERFSRLRCSPAPPQSLWLRRDADGCAVHGHVEGTDSRVATWLRRHGLAETRAALPSDLHADGHEIVQGLVRPSGVPALARALGERPLLVNGTGGFIARLPAAETDALLVRGDELGVRASVRSGAANRRGHGTPLDPVAARLADELRRTLDPRGILR